MPTICVEHQPTSQCYRHCDGISGRVIYLLICHCTTVHSSQWLIRWWLNQRQWSIFSRKVLICLFIYIMAILQTFSHQGMLKQSDFWSNFDIFLNIKNNPTWHVVLYGMVMMADFDCMSSQISDISGCARYWQPWCHLVAHKMLTFPTKLSSRYFFYEVLYFFRE